MNKLRLWLRQQFAILTFLNILAGSVEAQQSAPIDLSDASLEQLMNVEVTSASKREQKLSKVAAAIYVLNQEDIRRSGATSIPDLLRMVPGVDVAQVSGGSWAVSARGFNNIWADKLLVLIDGRSVYDPAFSGVFWAAQDVPLYDIERIEVIRGPGATVWGANAVNGVINIITKNSRDTAGGLIDVATGSQLGEQTLVQYGGAMGQSGNYRIFGDSTLNRANQSNILGNPANDANRILNIGFRSDWKLGKRDTLLVEGNLFSSNANLTYDSFYAPTLSGTFADTETSAVGSILGNWTHTLSSKSDTALRFYFDHDDYGLYGLHQRSLTADLDFQHHLIVGERNDIVWGLDARIQPGTVLAGYSSSLKHPSYTEWLGSAFLQDEIQVHDRWWLTVGTKFEYNNQLGASLQPSVRLLWAPNKRNSIWLAASRALREPSRLDVDVRVKAVSMLPGQLAQLVAESGDPKIQAESLLAYEGGYRFEPLKRFSLDLSTFYNRYSNLTAPVFAAAPFLSADPLPVHIEIPAIIANSVSARTYGAELSGVVTVSRWWKLSPGYSLLRTAYSSDAPTLGAAILQGDAPQQQLQFRSNMTLRSHFELDTNLYYVSPMVAEAVPAYTRLDVRIGWRFSDLLTFSLVGQNLLGAHDEFGVSATSPSVSTKTDRTGYLRATWHF